MSLTPGSSLRAEIKLLGGHPVALCIGDGYIYVWDEPVGATRRARGTVQSVPKDADAPQVDRSRLLTGTCFCGAVHYAVADEFGYAANCHCSGCRRATGSAFKPFAGIERQKLSITEGDERVMIFGDERAGDVRCGICGSLLYSVVRDGAFVHVALGTLIDAPSISPTKHIFVGSKAAWFRITDDLPQYAEHVVKQT